VAVKGRWHRHQIGVLLPEGLRKGDADIMRMPDFQPQRAATFAQPGIQFFKSCTLVLPLPKTQQDT